MLGTLTATTAANVQQSAMLPAGVVNVAVQGGVVYGLFSDKTVKPLGTFPTLSTGATLAEVTTPADRSAVVFLGGYLATNGSQLLAGYTKSGAMFPGSVALVQISDAGVQYYDAPGNFSAAGFTDGFALNGTGLGGQTGVAVYMLNTLDGGTSQLATFAPAWMAASGFSSVTSGQVLLLGHFSLGDFKNYVMAAPPMQYTPAVETAMPFDLSQSIEVVSGFDLIDVGAFGGDALVVHGGYQTSGSYAAYTTRVDRIPLTAPGGSVTVGTPVTLFNSADECTSVAFNAASGTDVLLGIKDKNGTRLVRVAP